MREQFKRAQYNYLMEILNICSIPLSVGFKNAFFKFFQCHQSSGFNCIHKQFTGYDHKASSIYFNKGSIIILKKLKSNILSKSRI